MAIIPYKNIHPKIDESCFIAPESWITGDVRIGKNVSIFFGAVLRGDILPITVGDETNIQEHAVIHSSHGRSPTSIGNQVTIGHRAIVHGCTIGNTCIIGMGSIILDEAVIGDNCLVGAGSVVTERKKFPAGSLIIGSPAKVVRSLEPKELEHLQASAAGYVETGRNYR